MTCVKQLKGIVRIVYIERKNLFYLYNKFIFYIFYYFIMPFKSKEAQLKYLAEYRKKNNAKLLERRKRRVMCACGTICSWNSLGRHRKTKTHMSYEEKNGGKTIKEYTEITECLVVDSDDEEEKYGGGEKTKEEKYGGGEKTKEVKVIAKKKEEKPIWKQFCKQCGNCIENHSIKRLISCGLLDNTKTIEFLKANIKN